MSPVTPRSTVPPLPVILCLLLPFCPHCLPVILCLLLPFCPHCLPAGHPVPPLSCYPLSSRYSMSPNVSLSKSPCFSPFMSFCVLSFLHLILFLPLHVILCLILPPCHPVSYPSSMSSCSSPFMSSCVSSFLHDTMFLPLPVTLCLLIPPFHPVPPPTCSLQGVPGVLGVMQGGLGNTAYLLHTLYISRIHIPKVLLYDLKGSRVQMQPPFCCYQCLSTF